MYASLTLAEHRELMETHLCPAGLPLLADLDTRIAASKGTFIFKEEEQNVNSSA
jgi:hypothetical protein